jgi:hypothetical protein
LPLKANYNAKDDINKKISKEQEVLNDLKENLTKIESSFKELKNTEEDLK